MQEPLQSSGSQKPGLSAQLQSGPQETENERRVRACSERSPSPGSGDTRAEGK